MKKTKRNLSDEKKQALIQRLVSYLEKEHPELVAAYIFGSFVSEKPFADIDVALLARSADAETLNFELVTENNIEQILGLPVDVRVMNTAPLSFQFQVIRNGQLILERDPNARAEYQAQILKQYFDFSCFRKRYLKEVVHAPF